MPLPPAPDRRPLPQADKDLLFKGVTCTLIGIVILLAPLVARSPSVRDLMAQAAAVGWFALVLGVALLARPALQWLRQK